MSGFYSFRWAPYVSVAERRRDAQRQLAALKKQGQSVAPVIINGRTIAKNFWGKSWCANLERYSDFASRLPRGRSYVRNGAVVDLQIANGEVTALVAGSELYKVKIAVAPVTAKRWKAVCRDCAGSIESLIELLQGRLATRTTERIFRAGDGLFPAPEEIKLSCSCPDWADMCKHVAATLYGVGARLDQDSRLLFVLRNVDENELLANTGQDLAAAGAAPPSAAKVLRESDVAALFGLDIATADADAAVPSRRQPKPGKAAPKSSARKPSAKRKADVARLKSKIAHAKPTATRKARAVRPPRPSR